MILDSSNLPISEMVEILDEDVLDQVHVVDDHCGLAELQVANQLFILVVLVHLLGLVQKGPLS